MTPAAHPSSAAMSPGIASVAALLKNTPYAPYAAYSQSLPAASREKLLETRLGRLLDDSKASWTQGAQHRSVACWRHLEWDSRMFGMSAARLEYLVAQGDHDEAFRAKSGLLGDVLRQCRSAGVRHLTARVDAGDLSAIHALEASGFQLLDGILTFSLRLTSDSAKGLPNGPGSYRVRLATSSDVPALVHIAGTAYVFDRFHADRALSHETANRVNAEWVRNSALGTAADATVVACTNDDPVAYVTCKVDWEAGPPLDHLFGTVVLVATAETERGRGAARAATEGALQWFSRQGVGTVEVGTQIRNVPAGRLYESCGFRLAGTSLTFRALL